ncbi:mechanosensitive ion channel domain-containing protein [Lyngbya aestuarii]|uniref:mechanosensitive ion channel domain-containing protein n=1 Tax=Lyngbya aestuarii TaxID=118322 RepID=UPI00403DFAC3
MLSILYGSLPTPDALPETVSLNLDLSIVMLVLAGILIVVASLFVPRLLFSLQESLASSQLKDAYQRIIEPYNDLIGLIVFLAAADIIISLVPEANLLKLVELPVSLSLTITASWLASRTFKRFFDLYLLPGTLKSGRKVNSELLLLAKVAVNFLIIVIAVIVFAQTHQVNILGLVASLGVGGLAVAFAAQKTLEQLLGGIVIYIDRPFVVDDYIGLPDGTFGRVESIGLRSTKIRASGKGTLVVVPNSSITQVSIENFTGAKKVISIIYLTFYRTVPEEEKAFVRQVILESTKDIFGIDPRSTGVIFKDLISDKSQSITQAQVNFFILGSGEFSMELRRQLLDIAKENITRQLKEYGIAFDIEDKMVNVDSPITI